MNLIAVMITRMFPFSLGLSGTERRTGAAMKNACYVKLAEPWHASTSSGDRVET